jgi:HK97 family phage prohead protease
METLYKHFPMKVQHDAAARRMKFTITTDAIDRDGDTLSAAGWDTTTYEQNPTVLWSHDYSSLPIAKTISIAHTKNGLMAVAEFPAKGVHPFADTVFELLKGGFLSAASVGFRPVEQSPATDRAKGFNYAKQELLEWSIVPIPANPEALVQMSIENVKQKGLLKPLVDWSEKFLGEYYGERGVYLPATQIEKVFSLITEKKLLTPGGGDVETKGELVTLDVDDELVLDLAEDVFDIERDQLAAHVRDVTVKALILETEQAVVRAVNYARGRVS